MSTFRARVLHIPKPKGGEVKAFDIPLSNAMIRCLVRVMRIGRALYAKQSREWLFPAESESGHIIEHKEKRSDLSKWGNDLRQTFRTIAQTAGVAELDVHLLMNHSIPGVNAATSHATSCSAIICASSRNPSHVGCSRPVGQDRKKRSVELLLGPCFQVGACFLI
ncbi:hypothetical protein [Mesorhizobium sp. M0036]|uniref:hypothetical protein n=1 Tax=Mesorhizobium sp. M0036 TaxID=2956853 RepID=UPI0033367A99